MNRVAKFPTVAGRIGQCLEAGLGYTCGVLDLEALWSARNPADYASIVKFRNGTLHWADTDDQTIK